MQDLGVRTTLSKGGGALVGIGDEPRELALLDQAKAALSAANSMDEVKSIRDKGAAAAAYARKARLGVASFNYCIEIVLRAERKAGCMLREMGGGVHGGDRKSNQKNGLDLNAIAELHDRERFYKLDSIPEDEFDAHIAEATGRGDKLVMSGVLKLAKKTAKKTTSNARHEAAVSHGFVSNLHELVAAGTKFSTIYADPPWCYDNRGTRSNVDSEYKSTMTIDDICNEPVSQLITDEAHLHLWTTNAFLFEARKVLEAWGFEYKSCFVWVKPQMGIGNYWRVSHEFMLLGVRGGLTFANRAQKSWLEAKRTKHSQKPHIVRNIIEKVSPGPYLEMYGRHIVGGNWTVYGNEVLGHAQRDFSIQQDLF